MVHVSGSFEFYQQFKSDRIMESFKNMVPHFAVVIREGKRQQIAVDDLVVGDIVEVKYVCNFTHFNFPYMHCIKANTRFIYLPSIIV